MKQSKVWKQFLVAAVASALASVFIVAVGPGFSAPNDNAAEQAVDQTSEETTTEETTEVTTTENESYVADPDTEPGGGDDIEENASTKADSHGHVGSGTGTSTGSQADPGHKEAGDPGYKAEDGANNGPGTGDADADECLNDKSSVNGDVDNGTPNGANKSGPYDSTCDGTNSENGQGSAAPGKGTPCAGCVGNADDKQPRGQVREYEGTKANDMGYECDGNQGVGAHYGRGNPAHTGDCAPSTTPTCPADSEVNGGMPIPEGETEESYCNEDEEPEVCPEDSDVNAGEPIPDGMTAEEYCYEDVEPDMTEVCRQVGGEWTIVEIEVGEERPTDLPADAEECDTPELPYQVCRKVGTDWQIVTINPGESEKPNDKPATSPHCAGSGTPFQVCREIDGEWTVITINPGQEQANDKPADAEECEEEEDTYPVCRQVNGTWVIVEIHPGDERSGDKAAPTSMNPAHCASVTNPPCPHDMNPYLPGKQCTPPPCPEDMNPYQPGLQCEPPEVCPEGTDNEGEVPPGGDMTKCNEDEEPPCPKDMNPYQPGLQCQPPEVCPEGTDNEGEVPPGGNMAWCDDDVLPTRYCPADSDMPGEPIPPGGIDECYPEVLDERIDSDGDVDGGGEDVGAGGEGRSRKPLGGVLPFTGTSILAYLLVALQMIGAGALIVRGRKAKK